MTSEHAADSYTPTPIDLHISGVVDEERIDEIRADIFTLAGKIGQIGRLGAMELMIGDEISEAKALEEREQIVREAIDKLTKRELEVSGLLVRGLTNAQIANELGVSENAIKHHVHAVLKKTGTINRAAAAVLISEAHQPADDVQDAGA